MTKYILGMLFVLALFGGLFAYAANATAKGQGAAIHTQAIQPTARPSTALLRLSQTAKPNTCEVYTGIERGTVNLRTCAGTSCAVVKVLTEGQSLNVLTAGTWSKVTTSNGVTGYINSIYCKGK